MTLIWVTAVALYGLCSIIAARLMRPTDAWEGAVALMNGVMWPLYLVGWLLARLS